MTRKSSNRRPSDASSQSSGHEFAIAAEDFPNLRSFLRGYFHQDMKDEYGSAQEAVREFSEDASTTERSALAQEWNRLLAQTQGLSNEKFNAILTRQLGSSYSVSADDLPQITALLNGQPTPE